MRQKPNRLTRDTLAFAILALAMSSQVQAQSPCEAMAEEAGAISGVVPKFENGQLVSVSIYGEGTFITPKRSLIANARKHAELQAKSFLSAFFKEQIERDTLHQSLMESAELTTGDGTTEAYAVELKRTADYISANSSAVLSGIVKLDECVDTDEKYILVRMGWKPNFVTHAQQAQSGAPVSAKVFTPSHTSTPAGIQYIEVETIGNGPTYEDAVRSALRLAVAQVFGESFASSQEVAKQVDTLELSDSEDNSYAVAVESTSKVEVSSSTTYGIIRKYQILQVEEHTNGFTTTLNVVLAEYNTGLDKSKQNIVVLPMLASSENRAIADSVQQRLEQQLARSNKFNLLDREFINAANNELGFVASGNSPVEELSRLGNQVGADLLVITEISNYIVNNSERQVGNRTLERIELNAEVRVKVINPATTEVVISDIVSINGHRVPKPSLSNYADIITRQLSAKVMGSPVSDDNAEARKKADDAKKRITEKQEKMEKEHENDW
jgi:curli biogenesis system outer membrane secretion channel CsgG